MWILRKLAENVNVTCIPLKEPFTVGRIECSFNITTDKSVSRRHAIINLNPNSTSAQQQLILTDGGSKFGTFVNGVKVTGNGCVLNNGDTIKFGGANSEFKIEKRDFSVYISTLQKPETLHRIQALSTIYGFPVVKNVSDGVYFVLEDHSLQSIESIPRDLVEALLEGKYIVSPAFYSQLLEASTISNGTGTKFYFSLALIQPILTLKGSKSSVPVDCWLPRVGRSLAIKKVLEGVTRLICGDFETFQVLQVIAGSIGIEVKLIERSLLVQFSTLAFNEILVIFKETEKPSIDQLTNPLRCVTFKSLIEAFLLADSQLIDLETLYPTSAYKIKSEMIYDKSYLELERESLCDRERLCDRDRELECKSSSTSKISNVNVSVSGPENDNYIGPSLTAVILMPSDYLKKHDDNLNSVSVTGGKSSSSKFVKCHPKHYKPNTIPALIGPDQLRSINSEVSLSANKINNGNNLKRRILIKDSWLAEDDIVGGENEKDSMSLEDSKNRHQNEKSINSECKSKSIVNLENNSISNNENNSKISGINSTNINSKISGINSTNNNSSNTSKFQSSFFKNLSKGSNK